MSLYSLLIALLFSCCLHLLGFALLQQIYFKIPNWLFSKIHSNSLENNSKNNLLIELDINPELNSINIKDLNNSIAFDYLKSQSEPKQQIKNIQTNKLNKKIKLIKSITQKKLPSSNSKIAQIAPVQKSAPAQQILTRETRDHPRSPKTKTPGAHKTTQTNQCSNCTSTRSTPSSNRNNLQANAQIHSTEIGLNSELAAAKIAKQQPKNIIHEASAIYRPAPEYPSAALRNHQEGWVKLEFTVTVQGQVANPQIIAAQPVHIFDYAALTAIRRWRFNPKTIDGQAVPRSAVQILEFKLKTSTR